MAKRKKDPRGRKPSGLPVLTKDGRVTPRIQLRLPPEIREQLESRRSGEGWTLNGEILKVLELGFKLEREKGR